MARVNKYIYIIVLLILISVIWGCSHKTLSVFFDGVPEMNDSLKIAANQVVKKTDTVIVKELAANNLAENKAGHPPFTMKKCRTCHDPDRKGKMIEPQPGLCYQCHEAYNVKFEHGPVVSGNCTACHSPHNSDNPKLLLNVGQALCINCHDATRLATTQEHENIGDQPCTNCHNPHGGNKKYFLN